MVQKSELCTRSALGEGTPCYEELCIIDSIMDKKLEAAARADHALPQPLTALSIESYFVTSRTSIVLALLTKYLPAARPARSR